MFMLSRNDTLNTFKRLAFIPISHKLSVEHYSVYGTTTRYQFDDGTILGLDGYLYAINWSSGYFQKDGIRYPWRLGSKTLPAYVQARLMHKFRTFSKHNYKNIQDLKIG